MASIEVELFTDEGNDAVLRLPSRRHPGVLIQGDSLHVLLTTTEDALQALSKGATDEAAELLLSVAERLRDAQNRYEAALEARKLPLPY